MSTKRKVRLPQADASIMQHPYIAKLQESTRAVVEESWEEVNQVHKRNSLLNRRIEELEKKLAEKEEKREDITSRNGHGTPSTVDSNDQAGSKLSSFGSLNDLLSPSFLTKKHQESKPLETDDEDQRQIMEKMLQMEQRYKAEVEQLTKTVQQHEATIRTLELALALEKSTVKNLKVVHQQKGGQSSDLSTRECSSEEPSPKAILSSLHYSLPTKDTAIAKGLQTIDTLSIKSLVSRRGSLSSSSALREELLGDLMGSEVRVLRRRPGSSSSPDDFNKRRRSNTGEVAELITRLSSSNLLPSAGTLSTEFSSRTSTKITGEANATFNF